MDFHNAFNVTFTSSGVLKYTKLVLLLPMNEYQVVHAILLHFYATIFQLTIITRTKILFSTINLVTMCVVFLD